ncbi:branched chain amino acid/phenylalanine ABC transporter ATP binding subunit LivF [Desulfovibrionales bacterium]
MLELRDIHTYYGNIHVLKGVRLTVAKGEIVTLIGANGAGKSTTLMTLCGIIRPRQGQVCFLGQDITRLNTDKIVRLGITQAPEGRMIFPQLTVLENLYMGAYARPKRYDLKPDLDRIFSLFPILFERRRQYGGTLSGGEQQMLAIGRAIMVRPKLLVLDEPSLGLAPIIVENIFEVITQINQKGTTVLLVEQNAQMALTIAHRGYVLAVGEVILEGTGEHLRADPQVQAAYLGLD